MPLSFRNAYYIKLGKGGCWEADSIETGKLRIGWTNQSVDDINAGNWEKIAAELSKEQPGKPGVVTTDLNRLRDIKESTPEDIWISFYGAKLWWTRLEASSIEQDETSKFRRCVVPWRDQSVDGRLLVVNDLPGKIGMLQGFRGTVCQVREHALLARLLSGDVSDLYRKIESTTRELEAHLLSSISELYWKDYETLVDLVFRHAGWERVSVLGQQAKGYDLELREPLTSTRYVVQIKSQASLSDLLQTVEQFSERDYRKVFFVVHTPAEDLKAASCIPSYVEVVAPEKLASLALDAGLVGWLRTKVA